ncbi:MAG: SIR2 family protein [Verrucomicrobiaceae bacterium]|nr:SIR2 family protein [Verrucomicrobiaceae bacterium]
MKISEYPDNTIAGYLPRLVAEYDRGRLVPFVGAGISAPNCALWGEFIFNLEKEAGMRNTSERYKANEDGSSRLIQRAARAVRKIRHSPSIDFAEAVRRSLVPACKSTSPPPATSALASIPWPLILTTNYDDLLLSEINSRVKNSESFDRMQVCGRGRSDSERIVNSLHSPDQPLLWAIQGFVGGQASQSFTDQPFHRGDLSELASQLVVGHEEYRREAFRSHGFRRAFSDVYRNRTFLFVGSGLSEGYFENLFDETIELLGVVPHNHFAIVEEGKLNRETVRERFQIELIEYPKGRREKVVEWVLNLEHAIQHRMSRCAGWGFSLSSGSRVEQGESPDLQIVRSRVPTPKEDECVVISVGVRNGKPLLGSGGGGILGAFSKADGTCQSWSKPLARNPHVWRYGTSSVFAVAARTNGASGKESRDARSVKEAMGSALNVVKDAGFKRAYAMLLSAGPGRVFPSHISLIQMARGFAAWKQDACTGQRSLELVICVVDPRPIALLSSGRLNLQEVLAVPHLRFWVEIVRDDNKQIARHLLHELPDTPLTAILDKFDLGHSGWSAWVLPSPVAGQKEIQAREVFGYKGGDPWTVENAGLVSGSILRVIIRKPRA